MVRDLPKFNDPNLLVGTEGFSDAAVYRLRDDLLLVQSVDFFPPLVDDPFAFGQIAAANSLSDVYAMGATPRTALNVVGFPDDQLDMSVLGEILRGGAERVQAAGAVIAGGHSVRDTEIKYGLSVAAVVEPDKLLTNRAARPGDVLVLTKALGTGFVTTANKAGRCPPETLAAAVESMIQLNVIGRDAAHAVGARAATDITGFGLVGHAGEMAQASGVTVVLDLPSLPLLPGVERLVSPAHRSRASASNRQFMESSLRMEGDPDPIALEIAFDAQTSGGLLIAVPGPRADEAVAHARQHGAAFACVVGRVVESQDCAVVVRG